MNIRIARGFTLIELLITIALIGALAGAVLVAVNPARVFAEQRNATRWSNVRSLSDAILHNITENRGVFTCAAGAIPTTTSTMTSTAGVGNYNICSCLVTNYLQSLPYDPSSATGHYTSCTDYDTSYSLIRNATTSAITILAPSAELSATISVAQ